MEKELKEVKRDLEKRVPGTKLVSCVKSLVRVDIVITEKKALTLCLQFPADYPNSPLLVEIKSKGLADRFQQGLADLCEKQCRQHLGSPQVLGAVEFAHQFLVDNPLCVCSEEIRLVRQELLKPSDDFKLRQKTSSINLVLREEGYSISGRLSVPHHYPKDRLEILSFETTFPRVIHHWLLAQANEIGRKCNEPPLKKNPKAPPFQPSPSLAPVMKFLVGELRRLPHEPCPLCGNPALPSSAQEVEEEPNQPKYVERVFCGHLFHYSCLDEYMKVPPFQGGKPCPKCKHRICHERWKASPQLAEARWAHEQARLRELEEVREFLQ